MRNFTTACSYRPDFLSTGNTIKLKPISIYGNDIFGCAAVAALCRQLVSASCTMENSRRPKSSCHYSVTLPASMKSSGRNAAKYSSLALYSSYFVVFLVSTLYATFCASWLMLRTDTSRSTLVLSFPNVDGIDIPSAPWFLMPARRTLSSSKSDNCRCQHFLCLDASNIVKSHLSGS